MSYITYKLIHFFGLFTLITTLAAMAMYGLRGGTRAENPYRRLLGAAHGAATLLVLVGGFGMLARLGVLQTGFPGWVTLKLVIWLALGGALTLPYLGKSYALLVLVSAPLLALAAGAVTLLKPF